MFNEQNLNQIQNSSGFLPSSSNTPFTYLISASLPYVFGIAGIILLINITMSGIGMMTSKGDPKALQSAQGKLTTSLIGVIILFTSFWIVRLAGQFLGIEVFKDLFGSGQIPGAL